MQVADNSTNSEAIKHLASLESGADLSVPFRTLPELNAAWENVATAKWLADYFDELSDHDDPTFFPLVIRALAGFIDVLQHEVQEDIKRRVQAAYQVIRSEGAETPHYAIRCEPYAGLDVASKRFFQTLITRNWSNYFAHWWTLRSAAGVLDEIYMRWLGGLGLGNLSALVAEHPDYFSELARLTVEIAVSPFHLRLALPAWGEEKYDKAKHSTLGGEGKAAIPGFPVIIRSGSGVYVTKKLYVIRCAAGQVVAPSVLVGAGAVSRAAAERVDVDADMGVGAPPQHDGAIAGTPGADPTSAVAGVGGSAGAGVGAGAGGTAFSTGTGAGMGAGVAGAAAGAGGRGHMRDARHDARPRE